MPSIPNLNTFITRWWCWWSAINPRWHDREDDGRPASDLNEGDWTEMRATGLNGWLSVIASLWWWRKSCPDASLALVSWHEALADVLAVVLKVIEADSIQA
ncbi:hypothetical protein ONZ45_g19068 [Pleurotus djamor]|nr:hypothetical protein ONZ45_g19068 [Pleurotus djamor]